MGRVEGRVALDLDSECTKNWLTIRNLRRGSPTAGSVLATVRKLQRLPTTPRCFTNVPEARLLLGGVSKRGTGSSARIFLGWQGVARGGVQAKETVDVSYWLLPIYILRLLEYIVTS